MKLSEIIEEWKHDAKIDNVELDRESLHIPNLHAKYLAILSEHRMKLKGLYLKRRNTVGKMSKHIITANTLD